MNEGIDTYWIAQVHNNAIVKVVITADRNGYALSCDVAEMIIQWRLNSGEIMRQWKGASKELLIDSNARWVAGLTGNHWWIAPDRSIQNA